MSFKIAVIGCGQISFSHHGYAYQKYAQDHADTELTACCDLVEERAVKFRDKFGFNNACTDWEEMLRTVKPDAVCLNVPPTLTAGLACAVMKKGFALILEKPPGMSVEEVDRMIEVAGRTGVPNQVAFNRRYMPLLNKLKMSIAEKFTPSQIQHIHYNFCRIGRTDADFSTTAIHGIDATRYIAGSDYANVKFHYYEMPEAGPHVANILMDCTFQSGTTAQLNFCPLAGLVIERADVHALNHTWFLETPIWNAFDYPGKLTCVESGKVTQQFAGDEVAGGKDDYLMNGFYQENASFFEDIRHGRRPVGDIQSGRQPVAIAQALRERRVELQF